MSLHIVILAAGQGTRMKSRLPKVLQPLGDRPLLTHVVETALSIQPERVHVVYGHGGDVVQQRLSYLDVNWVEQSEQKGTGHAVQVAMPDVPEQAVVLVLYGDVPLTSTQTLHKLVDEAAGRGVALLTMLLDDPTGYGRIVRDGSGAITGIVEQKDASPAQQEIREVNTGLLCCPARHLNTWLNALDNDNAQGEYYLTDIIAQAARDSVPVVAVHSDDIWEVSGVNDKRQLAQLERVYQGRIADQLMRDGLMLKDPARFDCRGSLEFGLDTVIDVNVVIEGKVKLADGVRIGPNCVLRDCEIGADSVVLENSVIERSRIGRQCNIGPFARLRPDTVLADKAKIGNFVETKQAEIGAGSKLNHLSYVGDARIGEDVNIGAGVITCNYDGAHKHLTEIGDRVFVGSDVQLVAPVKVEADATIGAGSTITKDVAAGNLAVSRSRQTSVTGWQRPQKSDKQPAGQQSKKTQQGNE